MGSGLSTHHAASRARLQIGGLSFDLLIAVLSLLLLAGLHLDGWAHIHVPELETFFTAWHAVFYSAFLATTVSLLAVVVINHHRGASWRRAVPTDYGLSLAGLVLFGLGGLGDLLWHEILGVEADLEALLSPTHLLLAAGGALVVSGPLRAAWRRRDAAAAWSTHLPLILSLAALLSMLTFLTQYSHPFGTAWASTELQPEVAFPGVSRRHLRRLIFQAQALGIAGFLLQSGLLMGILLPVLRRKGLPFGAITLLLTLNIVPLVFMRGYLLAVSPLPLIVAAVLAGISADVLVRLSRPLKRPVSLRLLGFTVPFLLYALYFVALFLSSDVWWSPPLWAGTPILAGSIGLLLSLLIESTGSGIGPGR